jgi:hypothetical protein
MGEDNGSERTIFQPTSRPGADAKSWGNPTASPPVSAAATAGLEACLQQLAEIAATPSRAAGAEPQLREALRETETELSSQLPPAPLALAIAALTLTAQRLLARQGPADPWRRGATAAPLRGAEAAGFQRDLDVALAGPRMPDLLVRVLLAALDLGLFDDRPDTRQRVAGLRHSAEEAAPTAEPPPQPPGIGRFVPIALVAVVLAISAVGGLVWLNRPTRPSPPATGSAPVAPPKAVAPLPAPASAAAPVVPVQVAAQRYANAVLAPCAAATTGRYPFVQAAASDAELPRLATLFGEDGALTILTDELRVHLAANSDTWRWRTGDPAVTDLQANTPEQLQRADAIRALLRDGVVFEADEVQLGAAVSEASLTVGTDKAVLDDQARPNLFRWRADGTAGAGLTILVGDTPRDLAFPGPWGLFRLMDLAQKTPDPVLPNAFRATFGDGAATVTLRIRMVGATNPFRRGGPWSFRCPTPL